MTVYRPKGCLTYRYDFHWLGERHLGTTHQQRKDDAEIVEANLKLQLRRQHAGIAPFDPKDTPRFQDWAKVFCTYQKRFITRPDLTSRAVDMVLEFWGAAPAKPKGLPAVHRANPVDPPYHDLRLGDPIAQPKWLLQFQQWIDARGVSGSTRNTYLSALSGFYRVALEPEYRHIANVPSNPFQHIRRSPRTARVIALDAETVLRWIGAAPYHVALAATIAALAPKMRLQTILGLRWADHFDAALTRCTVYQHKTAGRAGAPQVTPLSVQLQAILAFERARSKSRYVITYGGEPVASIKRGTRHSAEKIGLTWGVSSGVTFHTFRHSIATLLAELGLSEAFRKELLGHKEIRTTQQYTHLAAKSQIAPHEQLSAALPLHEMLMGKIPQAKVASGRVAGPPRTTPPKLAHIRASRTRTRKARKTA